MDISIDGVWRDVLIAAAVILAAYLLILWVASIVWTFRDIASRTRDPFLRGVAMLLVVGMSFPGLVVYLIVRPKETLAEAYDRRLEAEAIMHEIQEQATCPMCRRKIEAEFVVCPYCRSALRVPCTSCNRALVTTWVLCPYCGEDRAPEEPKTRPVPLRAAEEDGATESDSGRKRLPSTAAYTPTASSRAPSPSSGDAPVESST